MDTRLVIVKNGMTYLSLHIAVVVIAALISPKLAVLSAILVLISGCSIHIQRGCDAQRDETFNDRI